MENKWIKLPLGELLDLVTKGTTPPKGKGFVDKGINFIKSESISYDGQIDESKFAQIDIETHDKFKRSQIYEEDILFSMAGAFLGKNAVVKRNYLPANTNQALAILRINKDKAIPKFISFCLRNPKMVSYVNNMTAQSAQPNINFQEIKSLPINLPPLSEQKSIAHILGSLDDKIELNRQMNQTLEQMAQALFKSWFVDFDPVIDNALAAGNSIPEELQVKAEQRKALGKDRKALPEEIKKLFPSDFEYSEELEKWMPLGWESVKFDLIAEVKYGKDHKKLDEGTIPVYGSGGVMRYVNQSLYTGESVLIPRKGTLSNLMYVNEEFWSVDTMFFTKLKLKKHAKYLYYNLKLLDFNEMNVGSAVPSMTTKVLSSLNFILPPANLVMVFDYHIQGFYTKIEANTKQINKLTKTRDTLLPKLISGEVRV